MEKTRLLIEYQGTAYRQQLDHIGRAVYHHYQEHWHFHAVYHLILLAEGRHYLDLDQGRLLLEKNTLLLINPMVRHRFRNLPGETFEHAALLWRLVSPQQHSTRTPLPVITGRHSEAPAFQQVHLTETDALHFRNQVQKQTENLKQDLNGSGWELPFFHLWYSMLPFFDLPAIDSPERYWTSRIDEKLHRHFRDPDYALPLLAKQLERHPNYLGALYRKERHCAIGDELRRIRMDYAASLLAEGTLPIAAIAEASGCRPGGWFARYFREYSGLTPLAYRRQHHRNYGAIDGRGIQPQAFAGVPNE